jgi:electron transfer flavoprotein alpha subunit
MADILVFIETRAGKINKASTQALAAGHALAGSLGGAVHAAVIGTCDAPASLGAFGATKVHHVVDSCLEHYSQDGYAAALAKLAATVNPAAVLCAATSQGKDLAPRIAAKLDAGYASDVTAISASGGTITCRRPVYAGKGFITMTPTGSPVVASLRPNVFAATQTAATAEVIRHNLGIEASSLKSRVTEILAASGGKLDVAEADIIVSGGRGMKGPENWGLIENLAAALGAATGASRAVVDAGWRPHSEQVGQTGKTVSPKLYVAVGISGAIQHLAGMSSSKCIVAINKDAQAPIFKVADYGIVGDAFEILPRLTEELKKHAH